MRELKFYTQCPYGITFPNNSNMIRKVHRGYCNADDNPDCCKYCIGKDRSRKVVYCTYEEREDNKMQYEVIKDFTKEDYIVAHARMYGWKSFKESSAEFQTDMDKWDCCSFDSTKGKICDVQPHNIFSHNFWVHAVKFGFMKEKEVFYKRGDKFILNEKGEKYILAHVGMGKYALISLDDGNIKASSSHVENCCKITTAEFNKISGRHKAYDFTKIED